MQKYKQNNIFLVCSGADGIGKTWLTSALCRVLAQKQKKVLFFDADCSRENIAFQLGMETPDVYTDMLKGAVTLNNAVLKSSKTKFDLICSFSKENNLRNYPVGRAQILVLDIQNMACRYDHVFIDCSSENTVFKNTVSAAASKVIMLLSPSKTSLTRSYHELERIHKLNPDAHIFVAVNQVISASEGKRTFSVLKKAVDNFIDLNIDYLGMIYQDSRIRDCISNRTTLFERYPDSENIKNIEDMADLLQKEDK